MPSHHKMPVLDGMRGAAALVVVATHGITAGHLFPMGGLCVDFFFVLSGFVLGLAYLQKFRAGRLSLARFVKIRLVRLYPMVVAGTLWGALLLLAKIHLMDVAVAGKTIAGASFAGLLLLPMPQIISTEVAVPGLFPLNLPAWSLFFEFVSNIVLGLVARYLTFLRLCAAAVLWAVGLVHVLLAHPNSSLGVEWPDFADGLWRLGYSFTIGLACSYLYDPARVIRLRHAGLVALVLLGLCAQPYYRVWHNFVIAPIILFVMPGAVLVFAHTHASPKVARVCDWLGRLSYPLYMIHYPIVALFEQIIRERHLNRPDALVLVALQMACVLAAGIFAMRMIDAPLRRWLSQLMLRPEIWRAGSIPER